MCGGKEAQFQHAFRYFTSSPPHPASSSILATRYRTCRYNRYIQRTTSPIEVWRPPFVHPFQPDRAISVAVHHQDPPVRLRCTGPAGKLPCFLRVPLYRAKGPFPARKCPHGRPLPGSTHCNQRASCTGIVAGTATEREGKKDPPVSAQCRWAPCPFTGGPARAMRGLLD